MGELAFLDQNRSAIINLPIKSNTYNIIIAITMKGKNIGITLAHNITITIPS